MVAGFRLAQALGAHAGDYARAFRAYEPLVRLNDGSKRKLTGA